MVSDVPVRRPSSSQFPWSKFATIRSRRSMSLLPVATSMRVYGPTGRRLSGAATSHGRIAARDARNESWQRMGPRPLQARVGRHQADRDYLLPASVTLSGRDVVSFPARSRTVTTIVKSTGVLSFLSVQSIETIGLDRSTSGSHLRPSGVSSNAGITCAASWTYVSHPQKTSSCVHPRIHT